MQPEPRRDHDERADSVRVSGVQMDDAVLLGRERDLGMMRGATRRSE